MRFLGIEIAQGRLLPRRSVARLFGFSLAVLSFGLGFLGIVFGERRRGFADRFGRTDVVYDERRPDPAPWSQPPTGVPVEPVLSGPEPEVAAATEPAPLV
jgi:hypothetical protein